MRDLVRPIERWLAMGEDGLVMCPRTQTRTAGCGECAYFCRVERHTRSAVCSYPIPARETFARRASRDQVLRMALRHGLVRT